MKIRIEALQGRLGVGNAPDDAPEMLADVARMMFGLACFADDGRSIDPTHVKMDAPWPDLSGHREGARMMNERVIRALAGPLLLSYAGTPYTCEALASRDPGAS